MEYWHDEMEGTVPVLIQPPCRPQDRRCIGHASPKLSPDELLRMFHLNADLDAKLIRNKSRGDKWVIVL